MPAGRRGDGGCGTQPPQDGGKGTQPPYRPRTAVAGDACEAGEASQRRTRRGGLAAFGGPGFLDGELGGRVRFQALVGDRLAAADRSAVGALVKPAKGALDGLQPVAQVLRNGVVLTLLGERQRGVGFVFRLAVHFGLAVPLARCLGVLQQALHLVALGNEQAARAVLVHRAVLPESVRDARAPTRSCSWPPDEPASCAA